MNDKVDVLAVMNYASEVLDELGFTGRSSSLDKARAAVAELIESVAEFRRSAGPMNRIDVLRVDAALARVKGE